MSETIFTNEKIVPDWARGCEIDAEPQAAPSSTEVKLTSESQPQLLVPVEAINLVVRAFGESRRAAVSRMPLKQLIRETTRALHVLVAESPQGQRFAVGDICTYRKGV